MPGSFCLDSPCCRLLNVNIQVALMDLIPFMASIPERRFILSELKRDGRLRHFSESSLCVDNLTQEMQIAI